MTDIDGWEIDLRQIYGGRWRDRKRFGLGESLWEAPDGSYAVLLYGIGEIGINKEVGHLAVFRDKQAPVTVARFGRQLFWHRDDDTAQFGEGGLFLVHRYDVTGKRLMATPLLVDTTRGAWAMPPDLPGVFHRLHRLRSTDCVLCRDDETAAPAVSLDPSALRWRTCRPGGGILVSAFAWGIPAAISTGYLWALIRFAALPVVGTIDQMLPDGPLADETHFDQLWQPLMVAGPAFAAYVLGLAGLVRRAVLATGRAYGLAVWALVLVCLSPLVFMGLNAVLDRSPAAVREVVVLNKYESTDPNTGANPMWRLTLASWRPGRELEILPVSENEYRAAIPQQTKVALTLHTGYFGHNWIASYRLQPPTR
ncbi:MAG: hypothetical protein AB1724_05100 [Thermodesulfobacteriota bacterium]